MYKKLQANPVPVPVLASTSTNSIRLQRTEDSAGPLVASLEPAAVELAATLAGVACIANTVDNPITTIGNVSQPSSGLPKTRLISR